MADLNDLQAAQSVKIVGSDTAGTETYPVDATGNRELRTADILNSGTGIQGNLTVGTSAVAVRVGVSNLANRKLLTLDNKSNSTLYWGYTNSVTTTNGTRILKDERVAWAVGPSQDIYIIAGTVGNTISITEA